MMKLMSITFQITLLPLCFAHQPAVISINVEPEPLKKGTTFFVDPEKGKDSNNGRSESAAWRTLERVNKQKLSAGSKILFKSGQIFKGTLKITALGMTGMPIIYSSYGGKTRPLIDGSDTYAAIHAHNVSYIEFNNLKITNTKSGKVGQKELFTGILFENEDAGILSHIHFKNLYIYGVNRSHQALDEGKYDQTRFYGGVQFYTKGNKIRSNFDDVLIENCVFENLSRTGFNFRSDWDDRSLYSKFGDKLSNGSIDNWTPNTGVIFRHNTFRNIAGNGLIVRVAKNPLIEYNLFDSCGTTISGNAVFNFIEIGV